MLQHQPIFATEHSTSATLARNSPAVVLPQVFSGLVFGLPPLLLLLAGLLLGRPPAALLVPLQDWHLLLTHMCLGRLQDPFSKECSTLQKIQTHWVADGEADDIICMKASQQPSCQNAS
jgi:hypothetical protein